MLWGQSLIYLFDLKLQENHGPSSKSQFWFKSKPFYLALSL